MVQLNSCRLKLQLVSLDNLDVIYEMQCNEQVAQFNTIGIPDDKEFTKTLIVNAISDIETFGKSNFWWAIYLKENNQFLGEAGLNLSIIKYKSGEIFYSLHPKYWGNGYATEAVEAILNYGFVDLSLHRITAGVATENVKSIKLLERVGMQREGKLRKFYLFVGEWWDNYQYAILEEDFF